MTRHLLLACLFVATLLVLTVKGTADPETEIQAILFGTAFQESGLSLPGAKIVAFDQNKPHKKYRTVTNSRGEYTIRVPAGESTYIITASAPKFEPAKRSIKVYDSEKSTANLILKPRKKQ